MISITSRGDYSKTRNFLNRMLNREYLSDFDRYGQMGVTALSITNPKDSGLSARSWSYQILDNKIFPGIAWYNTDVEGGQQVVILIQYGHGTGTGGWVQGRDFINPTMQPVFDRIADDIWKKVKS